MTTCNNHMENIKKILYHNLTVRKIYYDYFSDCCYYSVLNNSYKQKITRVEYDIYHKYYCELNILIGKYNGKYY